MKRHEMFVLRLSDMIARTVSSDKSLRLLTNEAALQKAIASVVKRNFETEKEIEQEAERMMDGLEDQGQVFERHKMRPLIKEQLAKKRNFVL